MKHQCSGSDRDQQRGLFRDFVESRLVASGGAHLDFARSRFEEGERILAILEGMFPDLFARQPTVLDLGSGNGGVVFPFASLARTIALDTYVDADLRAFAGDNDLRVRQCLGLAQSLPFRTASIDIVLLAEVLEHLEKPGAACAEVGRVLRRGGVCVITTPPRLDFLMRPDPHFGIPFLLALPDRLQRLVVKWRRPDDTYNVHHIYATSWGIARMFPRGAFKMYVVSSWPNWARHVSWNYLVLRRLAPGEARREG